MSLNGVFVKLMSYASELQDYLDDLCSVLGHKNRHAPFQGYCQGLMLPLERKSVEPLAAHIDPGNVRSAHQSLHHFVADSNWSDRKLLDRVAERVFDVMGNEAQRYWMIDDTGMPKKGKHSVGVSHQYCGQLGKQANCQVAVSLSVAIESASIPVDYQLYLPKSWTESVQRCAQAGVPQDTVFRTKPEIALEQLSRACARKIPQGVVLADAGYGNDNRFREGIEALNLQYIVGIQSTTTVWAPGIKPLPAKVGNGKGRPRKLLRFPKGHKPMRVDDLAQSLPHTQWRQITWREGTNETLRSRFAVHRVRVAHRDIWRSEPRDEQWLVMEWPVNEKEPTKYWLSNLPVSSSKRKLVGTAKMRWRIERDYQELKQELGLNHYEGRNWRGFHHHASLCIAAYGFLTIQRLIYPARKKNRRSRKDPSLPESYVPRGAPENAAPR